MRRTQKLRRRKNKTDYKHRKKILKSRLDRIVFRKTNKHIIGQQIISEEAQDKIITSVNSKELINHGWPKEGVGSLKSIPAAYLTGLLLGKKILKKIKDKKQKMTFDMGLNRNVKKSRIYSFLKGIIDSGINIPAGKGIFPEEERLEGKNIKEKIKSDIEKIKQNIEKIK